MVRTRCRQAIRMSLCLASNPAQEALKRGAMSLCDGEHAELVTGSRSARLSQ
jgi:hypothetical protein